MSTAQHTIGIIVFDRVLTSEVIAPAEVFGSAAANDWFSNWRVVMIGIEDKETITTMEGVTLVVDCTIHDDLNLDVLIVPGAYDMSDLLANAALNAFIRAQEKKAEWMCSNCSGAFLLANSGVLDGKNATTWFGGETELQTQFPLVKVVFDAPMVLDNRHLTSNGGLVSYAAAVALLAKLTSPEHAREVFEGLQMERFGWQAIEALMAV